MRGAIPYGFGWNSNRLVQVLGVVQETERAAPILRAVLRRIAAVFFWAVIPAAFIGPGTVTTCASAGASHGTALLWALAFSTVACLALQEASARVAIATGLDVGRALTRRRSARGILVLGAVVLGCAAYEAGNVLGAAAGVALAAEIPPAVVSLAIGLAAGALLWTASTPLVVRILGALVAVMGGAFLATAIEVAPPVSEIVSGLALPRFPEGGSVLVLGLVGTTVVPYNLFLGSGLARGRTLAETRFGLAVAVVLGGIVSMAIVVVGTAVDGAFTFEAIGEALSVRVGAWGPRLVAIGLFAAGFTSAMTAPLAAAIAARGVLGTDGPEWNDRSVRFRAVWLAVLAVGTAFGVAGTKPIPAILLAQAANGVLLPFVAVSLLVLVNDRREMGDALAAPLANAVLVPSVAATVALGTQGILRAAASSGLPDLGERGSLVAGLAAAVVLAIPVGRAIVRSRGQVK